MDDKHASLTYASSLNDRRNYEKWDRSNHLSLMITKRGIPKVFRGTVYDEITDAKAFVTEIEKDFAKSDKAETSTILMRLISMKLRAKKI